MAKEKILENSSMIRKRFLFNSCCFVGLECWMGKQTIEFQKEALLLQHQAFPLILMSSFGSAITSPHFLHLETSNGSYIGTKTLTNSTCI